MKQHEAFEELSKQRAQSFGPVCERDALNEGNASIRVIGDCLDSTEFGTQALVSSPFVIV